MTQLGRGTTQLDQHALDAAPGRDFGRRLKRVLSRVPTQARVWLFSLALATVAAALFFGFLRDQPHHEPPIPIPWYVMAVAFFAAEIRVVDVHFRREKHSFSLSEFPAVVGFFLLSPTDYFLAMLTGCGVALLLGNQQPVKLAFNLANFAFAAAAALTVFYAMQVPDGLPDPVGLAGRLRRDRRWPPCSARPRSRPRSRCPGARRSTRSCPR